MPIDVIGILWIALSFFRGYSRGFVVAIFSAIAIILGIVCSLKLSQSLATWLLVHGYTTAGWAPVASYLLLFIGVLLLVRILATAIEKALEFLQLGMVNKIAGGVLYACIGTLMWSSILWLCVKVHLFPPAIVAQSKTYPYIAGFAPWFFTVLGNLLPFAKDIFAELERFFRKG
ncbi:MAG: CvpA family protein [Chitinophagia bacterium]|nr:CvpA family protein [Chitinophagia bacterium]